MKVAILLRAWLGLALMFSPAVAAPKIIAVASFGAHPQLDAVAAGFKERILASGLKEDVDVRFTFDHVNFDSTLLPQMISKIEATDPALVFTITTPVSQHVKNQLGDRGTPLIFAAVTDPVSAGLVPSSSSGDRSMSGATDRIDVDATLAFARKLFPQAKSIGVPYNPGEANDVATVALFEEFAPRHDFAVIPIGIDNTNDIQPRIISLRGKADLLYGAGSSLIQPAISAVAAAANEINVPLLNTDAQPVIDGIIPAAFSVSYKEIGQAAGELALRALNGEPLVQIAPVNPSAEGHTITISRMVMERLGAEIPAAFDDCGCIVE